MISSRPKITPWMTLALAGALIATGCGGPSFDGENLEFWVERLGSPDVDEREQAIDRLVAGGAEAVPVAVAILEVDFSRPGWERRNRAAEMSSLWVLPRIGSPAVGPLIEALADANSWKRIHAASALGDIEPAPEAAVEPLTRALADSEVTMRAVSARALAGIGPASAAAVPRLSRLLIDPDAAVRESAALALKEIGPPATEAARDALVDALQDTSESVRCEAVRALEVAGPRAADIPVLVGMLETDEECGYLAADAIAAAAAEGVAAVPALVATLDSRDWLLRAGAARALGRIGDGGASVVDGLVACLDDHIVQVRWAAVEALAELGASQREVLGKLRDVAGRDEEEQIRAAAAEALGRLE